MLNQCRGARKSTRKSVIWRPSLRCSREARRVRERIQQLTEERDHITRRLSGGAGPSSARQAEVQPSRVQDRPSSAGQRHQPYPQQRPGPAASAGHPSLVAPAAFRPVPSGQANPAPAVNGSGAAARALNAEMINLLLQQHEMRTTLLSQRLGMLPFPLPLSPSPPMDELDLRVPPPGSLHPSLLQAHRRSAPLPGEQPPRVPAVPPLHQELLRAPEARLPQLQMPRQSPVQRPSSHGAPQQLDASLVESELLRRLRQVCGGCGRAPTDCYCDSSPVDLTRAPVNKRSH
ncbi:hepatocyte growth factor-regulated tyrosine kinase substrate-like [Amphibalanus amphitrite]|uniref:hepatocyte growth factor-regulated tyrosine kinase substrate-like n=1 Tax=Amphibalanus amphitrite TaxID=1232801 RepID=UPI001C911D5F|nr:hepatocyte growth factor-regulated tyrosine kinase substrate-like [Amphibalanus amphitrite]